MTRPELVLNVFPKTFYLECFSLCKTDRSESSGTNQGKMERHFSIETNSQLDRSVPFTFRPKFRLLLNEVGLEGEFLKMDRAVASMRQDEALASSRFYAKKILLEK